MNILSNLKKIMAALNIEVSLEDAKLLDGAVIRAEVFEAGQDVFLVPQDAEPIPLPMGDYEMEDGRILVVSEDGVIGEVKDKPADEPAMEKDKKEVEQSEEVSEIESLRNEIADIRKQLESLSKQEPKEGEKEVELSKEEEKVKEVKEEVELSEDDKFKHSPEKESKVELKSISPNRAKSTQDRVFAMLFNK